VLVLQVAGACGSSGSDTGAPATDSSLDSTTTVPAPTDVEQAVLAAYQEFWRVWLRANNPPNPDYPDLARFYTASQLQGARASIAGHKARGELVVLPPNSKYSHHASAQVLGDGTKATIADCAIDDSIVEKTGTAEVINDDLVAQLVAAEMTLTESGWKVSSITFLKDWPGETECHVAS